MCPIFYNISTLKNKSYLHSEGFYRYNTYMSEETEM